jgi:AraC-like DNA-binding protein
MSAPCISIDPQRVASEVRRLLIRLLPSGQFDQDRVARQLNRSASTLHRQLGTENTSYREVLDSTRRGLAEEYLRDDKFSIAEVAYLLGFSDQSNFSRAFKRWTSRTPHEYRSG